LFFLYLGGAKKLIRDIQLIHEKGYAEVNEDAYVLNRDDHVFAVIDGATGIGGLSGKLAAETIKNAINDGRHESELWDRVSSGNDHLGKRILENTGATTLEEVKKEVRSACGLAAIRLDFERQRFDYVHAADCMIFLQFTDGLIRMLTYDNVSPFDTVSISVRHQAMKSMVPEGDNPNHWSNEDRITLMNQAKEKALPVIKENRTRFNTKGGYSILDGSPEALNFLETGQCSLNRVANILLVTDGLQLPNQKAGGTDNWLETASYAFEHGLAALKEEVDRMEKSDPACFTYPRHKPADDKTGILLSL
jgi:hypothetical protein